ncbi:MAG: hypothetical protein WD059_07365 [Balneolaceae bacterium]
MIDEEGQTVPTASNNILFSVEGPGEIVATDNRDPTSFTPFPSRDREAFNGLALVIIRGIPNKAREIKVRIESESLNATTVNVQSLDELLSIRIKKGAQ